MSLNTDKNNVFSLMFNKRVVYVFPNKILRVTTIQ